MKRTSNLFNFSPRLLFISDFVPRLEVYIFFFLPSHCSPHSGHRFCIAIDDAVVVFAVLSPTIKNIPCIYEYGLAARGTRAGRVKLSLHAFRLI